MNIKEKAINFRKKIEANLLATQKLIRVDELTESELAGMVDLYPELQMNVEYKSYKEDPQYYKWNDNLYKIEQKHTTQPHYNLDELPALYTKVVPKGVIRTIPNPITSTKSFSKGERGIWTDGKVYESTIDNNVWTPTAYPTGWKVVE